jgi:hypothetical protein
MVPRVKNQLILDFVVECKPMTHSLACTKKRGMGGSRWDYKTYSKEIVHDEILSKIPKLFATS